MTLHLKTPHLSGWINRQNFLVAGTLFLTLSPVLSVIFFISAALVTVFSGEQVRLTKEKKWLTGILFIISFWFAIHNHLPEEIGPGKVAFTDYVPFFWFFYTLSLKPFSDREIKKILYAFLFTVPQQFLLAFGEKFFLWKGRFYFPFRELPLLDIHWGPSEVGLNIAASFFNPNILTLYAIMGAVFSISLFFKETELSDVFKKKTSIRLRILFTLSSFVFSAILLIWTRSRNAWIFLLLIVLLFSWIKSNRVLRILGIALLAVSLLALINLVFPVSWINQILPQTLTSKLTVFSSDRKIFYTLAWELIQERPLWGWGIGTFPALVSGKLWYPLLHTHSLLFQLAVEIGVPFAVLTVGLWVGLIFSTALRLNRKDLAGGGKEILTNGVLIAGGVVFLMQFFDLALLMTYRLNFLFWLCLAIPYARVSTASNPSAPCRLSSP